VRYADAVTALRFVRPPWLTRDAALILASRSVRGFGLGALSVVIGLYLEKRGFSGGEVGAILAASLAGGTAGSIAASLAADRIGRRRFLLAMIALTACAAAGFAFTTSLGLLVFLAFAGNLGASGQEAFVTVEHAMIPQTAPPEQWNNAYAGYSFAGSVATALGSLASALPGLVDEGQDLWPFRGVFIGFGVLLTATMLLILRLSPGVELDSRPANTGMRALRPTGSLGRMTGLFALDGFAGGMVVQSFLAYWLSQKFGLEVEKLAVIFFIGGSLTGLSFPVAAWLANRIGAIRTMAFTHLAANVFLVLVPVMPAAAPAVTLLLARLALSAMDVPARQAYVAAMVPAGERTAAIAVTGVARNLSSVPGPYLSGALVGAGVLSMPIFLGGGLKIAYDLLLYGMFKNLRAGIENEGS
jgi:MFS family permease